MWRQLRWTYRKWLDHAGSSDSQSGTWKLVGLREYLIIADLPEWRVSCSWSSMCRRSCWWRQYSLFSRGSSCSCLQCRKALLQEGTRCWLRLLLRLSPWSWWRKHSSRGNCRLSCPTARFWSWWSCLAETSLVQTCTPLHLLVLLFL